MIGQRYFVKDRNTGYSDEEFAEEEIKIDTSALERDLTVPDRLRKIAQEFKKYYKPGQKTLVFAKNDAEKESHADALVKAFREELNYGDDNTLYTQHGEKTITTWKKQNKLHIILVNMSVN